MTYAGYLSIGDQDPLTAATATEIVNTERAVAYARAAGLNWLHECGDCPQLIGIGNDGQPYDTPATDPAPWYDPTNDDSEGFLGVVGLDVTGMENSTRQATVTMAMTGGGVIGPSYEGPRTIVVRAIAIAVDECGLSYGLSWLRQQYQAITDPCGGDPLTFFDCCPAMCEPDDGTPAVPCWPDTYAELAVGPSCNPTFWPTTYAELIAGPPEGDEEWCFWPATYRQLRSPPTWTCVVTNCVAPYLRQLNNCRVTSGPTVLMSRPRMNSRGSMAEIEFTVVAADPEPTAITFAI